MPGRKRRSSADFSDELQAHLELEIERLRAEGLSEEDAAMRARRELGNLALARERFYESHRWRRVDEFVQDTKLALRRLKNAPAFALAAALTLALGIGATTSIFTLVEAILLKSLAVRNPGDLYRLGRKTHCCVWGGYSQYGEFSIVSYDLYKHFRDNTPEFEELAAFEAGHLLLGTRLSRTADAAESRLGEFVSGNYFATFGVNAYAGRALGKRDDSPVAAPVAVMSYRLWRQRYGLAPSIIGSVFLFNGKPFTVVGVTPPDFFGETLREMPPDFFLPLAAEPMLQGDRSMLNTPSAHWLDLIGRVRRGSDAARIEARMRMELRTWLQSHWGEMDAFARANLPKQTLYLSPGGAGITSMREQYERWLQILMAAAGFVLLIVCANVANLMLVRGLERHPQISLSMALGASPARLVRQVLTECILLSAVGGAAGLALAFGGTSALLRLAFSTFPGFAGPPIDAAPSAPILLFTLAVSLVTGIIFGAAPAWMASRADPVEAMRGANRSTGRVGSGSRRALVAMQAALSLALLAASGLLTATLRNLENQNFGFEQEHRIVVNFDPILAGYPNTQLTSLYRRLHDSLMNVSGAEEVALCSYSPQSGDDWIDRVFIAGRSAEQLDAAWDRVTPGYLDVTGTPLMLGRDISERDSADSVHIAVVNQAFTRSFFKGENPIGKRFGRSDAASAGEFEIVGVAKDARYLTGDLDRPVKPFVFLPEPQYAAFQKPANTEEEIRSHYLTEIVIRERPGAHVRDPDVRRAIAAVDPRLPINFIRTLREQVEAVFSRQRLLARLTSLFGVLSLLLAGLGVYGIAAFNASRRTREIGVRMALGANRSQVVRLIVRDILTLILTGLAAGVPLSFAAGRFLSSQLYGVSAHSSGLVGLAALALCCSAIAAAIGPALRASGISPMRALRSE